MQILGMLKATKESEAGAPPSKELIERMGAFVEEVTKAGVMLSTNGLHPSARGKRVRMSGWCKLENVNDASAYLSIWATGMYGVDGSLAGDALTGTKD